LAFKWFKYEKTNSTCIIIHESKCNSSGVHTNANYASTRSNTMYICTFGAVL